jgi:hypothetical protein
MFNLLRLGSRAQCCPPGALQRKSKRRVQCTDYRHPRLGNSDSNTRNSFVPDAGLPHKLLNEAQHVWQGHFRPFIHLTLLEARGQSVSAQVHQHRA